MTIKFHKLLGSPECYNLKKSNVIFHVSSKCSESNMLHQLLSFMIFKSNQRFLRNILIEHQDVGLEPVGSIELECASVLFLVPSLGGLSSQSSALVCLS